MSAYKKFAYDLRLDGKVAVVTGGTSGIGQETARMLAWKGATVIIFGRNPKIHEIAAQLGPKVTGTMWISRRPRRSPLPLIRSSR